MVCEIFAGVLASEAQEHIVFPITERRWNIRRNSLDAQDSSNNWMLMTQAIDSTTKLQQVPENCRLNNDNQQTKTVTKANKTRCGAENGKPTLPENLQQVRALATRD